jgi:hypothetical protein
MRVSWITFGAPQRLNDGRLTSDIASLRYRVLSPIAHLGQGYRHRVIHMNDQTSETDRAAALEANLLIFSKSFLPANEHLAERAKAIGIGVIFDICDHHFEHPQFGRHYRAMTEVADRVICNTEAMAQAAAPYANSAPTVIADPYEGQRGEARFAPHDRLRLLWFGHPTNLDSLDQAAPDLIAYAARRPAELTILTQPNPNLPRAAERLGAAGLPTVVKPWSQTAQWVELAACDVVIIPSLPTAAKHVKSANRMIEALWAGRPVVAQPMPAYEPFAQWTPIRPTLSEGLAKLEADPAGRTVFIEAAQAYIADAYDPAVIGRQWDAAIQAQRANKAAVQ